jgi:hypothetical protein
MHIYVRRGGPNYQSGLAKMRKLGAELGVPISVFKSSTSRRLVVQSLLRFRLESPTRLSGQVGRLAGDLSFSVD